MNPLLMWFLLALGATGGFLLASVLFAGVRADLEREIASLRRRLLARDTYEEHA